MDEKVNEELEDTLTAISVVSKHLAKKLKELKEKKDEEEKDGKDCE